MRARWFSAVAGLALSGVVLSTPAYAAPPNTTPWTFPGAADVWFEFMNPMFDRVPANAFSLADSRAAIFAELDHHIMPNRRSKNVYMLGDDRLHVVPRRIGLFGWGLAVGSLF